MSSTTKRRRLLLPLIGLVLVALMAAFWLIAQQEAPLQQQWTNKEISRDKLFEAPSN